MEGKYLLEKTIIRMLIDRVIGKTIPIEVDTYSNILTLNNALIVSHFIYEELNIVKKELGYLDQKLDITDINFIDGDFIKYSYDNKREYLINRVESFKINDTTIVLSGINIDFIKDEKENNYYYSIISVNGIHTKEEYLKLFNE